MDLTDEQWNVILPFIRIPRSCASAALEAVLRGLAEDLRIRGKLDLTEATSGSSPSANSSPALADTRAVGRVADCRGGWSV
jgi:hypothetical protein